MKTLKQTSAAIIGVGMLLGAQFAYAGNITIEDNNLGSKVGSTVHSETSSGWYKGDSSAASSPFTPSAAYVAPNPGQSEYQEVEPGMQTGAKWDLAAFVTPSDATLGVISGYKLDGITDGTTIGDIFVSTDKGSLGPGFSDPNSNYGHFVDNGPTFNFDFAIQFDFPNNQYHVIDLASTTSLEMGEYWNGGDYNASSQPWRVATGQNLNVIHTGTLTYTDSLSNATATSLAGYTITGAYNYYAQIDMTWLESYIDVNNADVLYKLTMACGNDNMVGEQTSGFQRVPDNASTLSLLGIGFLMLAGLARRRNRKSV
jgi:hypothetical protein